MTTKSTPTAKKPSQPSKQRWTPPPYQRKAVKWLLEHGAAALFLDPGLGKTSITLAACKVLLKEGSMAGALVVAPLRPAHSTWPNEAAKWADFEGLKLTVLHGGDLMRKVQEGADIFVINYEGLPKLFSRRKVGKVWKYELTELGKELLKRVDTLIWDELSKMKNSNTLRYTLVKPWLRKFVRRWGLTGSPASNGLLDLFGQCYVLDEGNALGPFITHYRAAHFMPLKDGFTWVLRPGEEQPIYAKLRKLALRMEAEDYLRLPRQLDIPVKLDLPAEARQVYTEMEKELLTMVEDEVITAANAAAASSKCRQICSGALYKHAIDPITGAPKQRDRTWALLHDEKLDALEDLIGELQGQQLLVAYDFVHDLERLRKRFPGAPYIGGGVSAKRGKELEDLWNAGDLPLLFAHPVSTGHGLNLQESHGHHIAWLTLTWDFEVYDQFNRRLRRQGNEAECVRVYHFVMRDTVEESVAFALRRKFKTQKELLDALKTRKRWD